MLRATTACTFSTSQLVKVVRSWCVLYILTWKCASRHNGVQFFISHLASWLRTRRFSEPTFRPSGASHHWRNTVFRDFPTFSCICIFFLLTLSLLLFSLLIFLFSLTLSISAFHLSILSEVWLLNFLRLSYPIYPIYPIYLSISLSLCLSVYLSTCLSARLLHFSKLTTSKTKQFCETSSIFELDNIQNEAILRDFLNFWTWQHPKRSKSARLLQLLNLTTSKTKQFCETSFKNGKLTAPYQCVLQFFHLSKVLRLPRKIDARSYEVLHLSRKIILANRQIWCSKMQPLSGNQRPDLLTSLMNMSFVLRLPREMHLCRSSSNVPRLPSFLEMLQNPHVLLTFEKVHNPLRLPRETTSERPKVARTCGVLYILTSKCASRHSGVHFFDISTSKSGPNPWCF